MCCFVCTLARLLTLLTYTWCSSGMRGGWWLAYPPARCVSKRPLFFEVQQYNVWTYVIARKPSRLLPTHERYMSQTTIIFPSTAVQCVDVLRVTARKKMHLLSRKCFFYTPFREINDLNWCARQSKSRTQFVLAQRTKFCVFPSCVPGFFFFCRNVSSTARTP